MTITSSVPRVIPRAAGQCRQTVNLILDCPEGGLSDRLQDVLSWSSGNRVTAELPLIGAVAVEVEKDDLPFFARFGDSLRVFEDAAVTVPKTEESQVNPLLNSAAATVKAPQLWEAGLSGSGIGVAVIDTGVATHQDLEGRVVAFHDLVNGRTRPYDDHGHGTHVAGIVAGDGADSDGRYKGIAPEANIIGIKAFNDEGSGKVSDVIKAIQWAITHKDEHNIKVLNLSAKTVAKLSYRVDPLARAIERSWDFGLVPVVAVGNEGPGDETIGSPAHAVKVISVGGVNDRGTSDRADDRMYRNSARGPTPVDGLTKPDLVAPAQNIRAAANRGGGYVTKSGTSMAAPAVSGLAALMLERHPEATPAQVKLALTATAERIERLGEANDQGSGLVDGERALAHLTRSLEPPN